MNAIKAVLKRYHPLARSPYTQIILEIPEEHTQAAITALGYPKQGESLWVGVARITEEAATQNEPPAFLKREESA